MVMPAWAFTEVEAETRREPVVPLELAERLGPTHAVLTSAIDNSPFVGAFDPETGIASFYDMDGELSFYRHVESEEAFWELVQINAEVTSPDNTRRMAHDRVNRNTSVISIEERLLIEYDEHGNRTETYLSDEFAEIFPESAVFENHQALENVEAIDLSFDMIAPMFSPVDVNMFVPFSDHPNPREQRQGWSVLVGGRHHQTTSNTTRVILRTFSFPMQGNSWMWFIDVFITNQIGDCNSVILDMRDFSEFIHNVRFPGEPYGAWVSSFDGSFNNVRLSFSNTQQAQQQQVTIHLNPNNWGTVSPNSVQRNPGGTMGFLPTPTPSAGWRFVAWYNTPAQTGGARITNNTIVPNHHTTYWTRWRPDIDITGRWANGSFISFISHRDFSDLTMSQFQQGLSNVNSHIGYNMLSNSSQRHIMFTWLTSSHNADGLNRVYRQVLGTNRALGYCQVHWHRPNQQINGYWQIGEADMVINVSHPFANNPVNNNDFDVATVLLHEAAHAVGLSHTNNRFTNNRRNIMYRTIWAREQIRQLGPDDIAGIRYLDYRR